MAEIRRHPARLAQAALEKPRARNSRPHRHALGYSPGPAHFQGAEAPGPRATQFDIRHFSGRLGSAMKTETIISVEQQLLLTALACPAMAGSASTLPALLDQVNWHKLLAVTSRDLYPYLCFSLEPYMEGREAPPQWEVLRTARRLTAVDNLRFRHELANVTEALTHAGIPALALKGIVLAYAAYKDPSLRPMMDLDLLVPPGERENAIGVLQKLEFGYSQGLPIFVRDHMWRFAPEQEFAPPLQSGKSRVQVELHTQLECSEPHFRVPVQEFWFRSTTVALGGLNLRTLCPEDHLFHVCLHQARAHRFEKGLLPLLDIKL